MRPSWLVAPPLCSACRVPVSSGDVLCAACRRALEHLGPAGVSLSALTVWAPLAYEGPARAVVRGLKFHGAVALADHMAATIAANAPPGVLEHPLAPVPSPRARRRLRGFCHAALVAAALGRRTGLPVVDVLARGDSRRQVGRARAERLRTPPAFTAARLGSSTLVLVDDVVTTGATLGACAAALREAGWRCGHAVAYARTPVR